MRFLRHLLLASAAGLLLVGGAQAADLPTKKTPPAPPATSCFASFMSWLNSTAADCPLSYMGITLYGTIDIGAGYSSHGTAFNNEFVTGVEELIQKNSQGARYTLVPNGLSQSNVGVKISNPWPRPASHSSPTLRPDLIPTLCSLRTARVRCPKTAR